MGHLAKATASRPVVVCRPSHKPEYQPRPGHGKQPRGRRSRAAASQVKDELPSFFFFLTSGVGANRFAWPRNRTGCLSGRKARPQHRAHPKDRPKPRREAIGGNAHAPILRTATKSHRKKKTTPPALAAPTITIRAPHVRTWDRTRTTRSPPRKTTPTPSHDRREAATTFGAYLGCACWGSRRQPWKNFRILYRQTWLSAVDNVALPPVPPARVGFRAAFRGDWRQLWLI